MKKIYLSLLAAMMSVASFAQVTFTCTGGAKFGEGEGCQKLFDGDLDTKYCGDAKGNYVLFSASEAIYVWGYEFTTANDNEQYGRCIKNWVLKGSTDEEAATNADSESWVTLSAPGNNGYIQKKNYNTQRFFVDNGAEAKAYKYFKLEMLGDDFIQFSEFALCYEKNPVVSYKWVEGSSDNAQKVLDRNLGQKWEGNNLAGNWFTVETSDGQAHTVKSYSFTTHDDGDWNNRAPKHWTLEGSNDNTAWEMVDEVSDDPIQNKNYTTFTFAPAEQDKAYRYLKVSLVEMKSTGWTQIGEFFALGGCATHNWVLSAGKEPTCSEEGGAEYTCSVCGAHKMTGVIPATGIHDFVDGYCSHCNTPDPEWLTRTPEGFYVLTNVDEMKWVSAMIKEGNSMHIMLACDIDLEGSDFHGFNNGADTKPFMGEFDGQNHIIYNLHIDTSEKNVGLFGNVKDAHIHNLALKGAYVKTSWGNANSGGIVGNGEDFSLSQCAVIDSYVEGYDHVGALAGNVANNTNIMNCYSDADILSGAYQAGGLVGTSDGLFLFNCVFTGTVRNNNFNSSGLVALIDGENFGTTLSSNLMAAKSLWVGQGDGLYSLINTAGRQGQFSNNWVVATTTYQAGDNDAETRVYDDLNGANGKTIGVAEAQSAEFAFNTLYLDSNVWAVVPNEYPQLFWVYDALNPGVITRINAVENTATATGIYNLAGQKMTKTTKGINIVNGKKYVVK